MTEDTTTAALKSRYLGRTLQDVPAPAAVLDLAKLEVNCQRMIDATKRLGMLWRPHIKTHKVNSTAFCFQISLCHPTPRPRSANSKYFCVCVLPLFLFQLQAASWTASVGEDRYIQAREWKCRS